jgi:hypothetical protein
MLHTLPYIVSPTTTRAGFKNRLVTKDTYEVIPGDGAYIGKYDIPEADLLPCDRSLDFACLLAIGTTPFNLQAKQLDGLDKTSTLRSVRFTGVATYAIKPGVVTRSSIQLITDAKLDPLIRPLISVFIEGEELFNVPEGNNGIKVLMDSLALISEEEGSNNQIKIFINDKIVDSQAEGSNTLSVKMDGLIVSSTLET